MTFDMAYIRARVDSDEPDDCWLWKLSCGPDGYGRVNAGSGERLAHRLSYRIFRGPIVNEIDHLCRNRPCVNPAHLEDVPARTNMRRAPHIIEQLERTHCPAGHPYAGSNLRLYKNKRACRQCAADARDRHRARQREARHAGTTGLM